MVAEALVVPIGQVSSRVERDRGRAGAPQTTTLVHEAYFRLVDNDPEGRKLVERLRQMIVEHKKDPQLVQDLLRIFGGSLVADHSTLQVGLITDVNAIVGGGGVTGVAIPLKGDSKVKWFSGVEVAGGGVSVLRGWELVTSD